MPPGSAAASNTVPPDATPAARPVTPPPRITVLIGGVRDRSRPPGSQTRRRRARLLGPCGTKVDITSLIGRCVIRRPSVGILGHAGRQDVGTTLTLVSMKLRDVGSSTPLITSRLPLWALRIFAIRSALPEARRFGV